MLRPAGYFLSTRIEELNEKFRDYASHAIAAGIVFGITLAGFFPTASALIFGTIKWHDLYAYSEFYIFASAAAFTVAVLAWSIRSFILTIKTLFEIRNCTFGLRGEQAVAESLSAKDIAALGCFIFHDIPGDGAWNIDHVVLGPFGILVVETKVCAKRKSLTEQPEHETRYDDARLQFPWRFDQDAVPQVTRNADWVKKFVCGFGPEEITIIAVVVIPGWNVISSGNYRVKAMPETYLAENFIPGLKRRYTLNELEPIRRRFDERCRTIEF